ncbi:Fc.00g047380.m01.CDS01 [Cosmosporella sp. VM-42]
MDTHDAVVKTISERVKQFYMRKEPFRLYHGSTNSTRHSVRRVNNTIDTSKLNHVLAVDPTAKTALVEPNVPMDDLLKATLKHNLIPPVMMEFPGITVGGGFSGTSGESSSFRYGAFEVNINSIEIVTPDGTVMKASKTEKPDLFWGAASAFGTLGVVTLLELQLKDAKKYVHVDYIPSWEAEMTVRILREECKKEANDYVDAIVFSKDAAVVCAGRLVDEMPPGYKPQRLTRRYDPWFYLRAQKITKKLLGGSPKYLHSDYIPLVDYIFRYDRGGFWGARYAFQYFITPFNRITRFILDPLLRPRVMYRALHKSDLSDFYMVQDVGVPYDKAEEFQNWLHDQYNIYPLWLCPLRIQRDTPDSGHGLHSEFAKKGTPDLMNFGVWGPLKGDRLDVIRQNRDLERKVQELQGKKWLYAHAYYTEDEFWAHYDRGSYDALRAKYKAEYLPSVYDKVKVDVKPEEGKGRTVRSNWPVAGLKGAYKAFRGGEYLLQKTKKEPVGEASKAQEE